MRFRIWHCRLLSAAILAGTGLGCSPSEPASVADPANGKAPATAVPEQAGGTAQAPQVPPAEKPAPASTIEYARFDGGSISKAMFDKEVKFVQRQRQAKAFMVQQTVGKAATPIALTGEELRSMLQSMVDLRLTLIVAKRDGIEVSMEEIEAIVNRDLKDDQSFRDYLNWQQITEADLRRRIREREISRRFIEVRSPECAATPAEVEAEYARLEAEGKMEEKASVDFWQILLKVKVWAAEPEWDAARTKLEAIRARILAGEEFGTVAREASEDPGAAKNGGYQAGIPRGMMPPEMEAALFELPVGEISEPIRVSYGWHLIRVKDRRETGTRPLERAAGAVAESLVGKCRGEVVAKIMEQARKDFHAEILVNPAAK